MDILHLTVQILHRQNQHRIVVARPCYITRVPYRFYGFYWVGGGSERGTLVCARVFWVAALIPMSIYLAECLSGSGSICACALLLNLVNY